MQIKCVISKQVMAMAIAAVMIWCSPVGAQTAPQPTTQATVTFGAIAGVPVTIVTALKDVAAKPFVLINIHGGGFQYDCCSLAESIPIASLLKAEVIAVRYRTAPEHPFPAGIDDVIAVHREVLKTHSPAQIAMYGTSSGAIMTGEVAMKLRTLACLSPPRWESF